MGWCRDLAPTVVRKLQLGAGLWWKIWLLPPRKSCSWTPVYFFPFRSLSSNKFLLHVAPPIVSLLPFRTFLAQGPPSAEQVWTMSSNCNSQQKRVGLRELIQDAGRTKAWTNPNKWHHSYTIYIPHVPQADYAYTRCNIPCDTMCMSPLCDVHIIL